MQNQQGSFRGAGGLDLFYQSWTAGGAPQEWRAPRAVVGLVHGVGDHSGRFERLVEPLTRRGLAVYAFDLRGFGRSPGRRGHLDTWSEYGEDARAFLDLACRQQPGAPVYLLGYSLGAAIVLDFIQRQPEGLQGAILIGAPVEPVGVATPLQVLLARVLSRIAPTFAIQMTNDIHGVSRDAAVLAALEQDPLHHSWVTARWGSESLAAMDRIRARAAEIRLPVLFLHGGDDPFNRVSGVRRFVEAIPAADKTLIVYPGGRHEIHNDLDHARVAADMGDWILNHSKQVILPG